MSVSANQILKTSHYTFFDLYELFFFFSVRGAFVQTGYCTKCTAFVYFVDLVILVFIDFLSFFRLIWQIRDGGNESSPSLGRYCSNTSLPGPFMAASNQMWVKFVTDDNATGTEFRAIYTSGYTSLCLSISPSVSASFTPSRGVCARVHAYVHVRLCGGCCMS